jgi:fermentation-respiration switch protein FrsA (DUF1100 family)
LKQTSEKLYGLARESFASDSITLYGKSIGTGIAAYLASVRPCKQLVLETPYYSLSSIAKRFLFFLPVKWLMRYNINTYQYFEQINAPITLMHGTADQLIPLENALGLLENAKPNDAFYVIDGGEHNNLPSFPLYQNTMDSLFEK